MKLNLRRDKADVYVGHKSEASDLILSESYVRAV